MKLQQLHELGTPRKNKIYEWNYVGLMIHGTNVKNPNHQ